MPDDGLKSTIPLKLGDTVVGWATADLVEVLRRTQVPHLLVAPIPPEVLAVRTQERFVLVPQAAITYVSSLGGVTAAYTDAGRYWTDMTLTEVERRLDPRRFIRLDPSHLVNLTWIVELLPMSHQRYRLVFGDQAQNRACHEPRRRPATPGSTRVVVTELADCLYSEHGVALTATGRGRDRQSLARWSTATSG